MVFGGVSVTHRSILVVDDDEGLLNAIECALEPLGFSVVKARSGYEALRLLLDRTYSLILLDVMMPGMDGFETAKAIRGSARHRPTPIVFLTGQKSTELTSRGYVAGAVDFLEKPVELDLLRAKVRALVGHFDSAGAGEPLARVLIVDDEESNLQALAAALSSLHEDVETAGSGEEALERLETGEFAVVLLDVVLPGMSGLETAAAIQGNPRTRDLPIVLITARTRAVDDIRRGYELGAVDFLLAPVAPDILRAKVTVFVELFKKRERLRQQQEQESLLALAHSEMRVAEERLRAAEESKKIRDQLVLSDRLVCVGTLAASVAHEVNNPLAVLISDLSFAREQLERLRLSAEGFEGAVSQESTAHRLDEACGALDQARDAAERIRTIVNLAAHVWARAAASRASREGLRTRERGGRQRGTARPGLPQPPAQRRPRNQAWRIGRERGPHHDPNGRGRAGQRRVHRHRLRDPERGPAADLRVLLHHQARRNGHRAWTRHLSQHR